ncbi:hypothetical Protein YC6258_05442 [Gynuella sunshinyii YC6258]|uniref:Uncharacterized protein n=1 Tax=Gynuella sunshinyii YC6258 TaxID=1445510 RepID=A0A0C5VS37_9GAMM|nr:hypothetical Protein YC6258_05442 [Gynuella sunshinyii YC6258]
MMSDWKTYKPVSSVTSLIEIEITVYVSRAHGTVSPASMFSG